MNIQLPSSGLHTIGYISGEETLVSSAVDTNLSTLKTMINGQWRSWSKGAPEAFQGFTTFTPGLGYVCSTLAPSNISIPDTPLDPMNIPVIQGLNFLAYPSDLMNLSGYTKRFKGGIFKTMDSGTWKSWTIGAPSAFQGFVNLTSNKGYVINVEKIFDNNIDSGEDSAGVLNEALGTFDSATMNGSSAGGISVTDPGSIGQLLFNSKSYDNSTPTGAMFFRVNSNIVKIDFPTEYTGEEFVFELTNGNKYSSVFVENPDYANPTETVPYVSSGGTISASFNSLSTQGSFSTMWVSVNGSIAKIVFDNAYLGKELILFDDIVKTSFTTTFQNSGTETNPIVIS
jgi:hypothetical protein